MTFWFEIETDIDISWLWSLVLPSFKSTICLGRWFKDVYLQIKSWMVALRFYCHQSPNLWIRDAFKKKNCWEGDIGPYGREGGKKNPLFLVHQKGDIFLWREGSKSFCHMSHVHFGVSVSTQFVAFLEALHNVNFLNHVIKYLTWLKR